MCIRDSFVNVGLKEDGLLHVSKMGPLAAAGKGSHDGTGGSTTAFVGQPLSVLVLSVDVQRRRLSLGLDHHEASGAGAPAGGAASKRGAGCSSGGETSSHKRKRS